MTSSRPSDSDPGADGSSSRAFEQLDIRLRKWIWDNGWTALRGVQERAIPVILEGDRDVVIAASTAGGKTEAAFLPICSRISDVSEPGVSALYVSPLKALINDQFRRAEDMCSALEVPVHRWHGDISSSRKRRLVERPDGVLLITPESLEALFVTRGHEVARILAALRYVVVDELHAFIGADRGRQLQSLLHRVELCVRRRVPRVGLSATLGDMDLAARELRPFSRLAVEIISSSDEGAEVQLQLRGYIDEAPPKSRGDGQSPGVDGQQDSNESDGHAVVKVSEHLLATLRGSNNLVFLNARSRVEEYSNRLRRLCELKRLPNEFLPHHGSLSKELREEVEARLRTGSPPLTALCTSTLEMGIDIGAVTSVAQVGPPWSVAGLRQRLGRSGRRGDPAVLRMYVIETGVDSRTQLTQRLRTATLQSVAMAELLIDGWCEPPSRGDINFSTCAQQVMSLIAQHGGVSAIEAWRALCEHGPFGTVEQSDFIRLLKCMGDKELIEQDEGGLLLLGGTGEKIVGHHSFFVVFPTTEEYRVVCDGRTLGTLPLSESLTEKSYLMFAGRRWRVISVDEESRVIFVKAARGGRPPRFGGGEGLVHDAVRLRMRVLYEQGTEPPFLTKTARMLLVEGRKEYVRSRLDVRSCVPEGEHARLYLCRGDRIMNTVATMLTHRGMSVEMDGPSMLVSNEHPERVMGVLSAIASSGPVDAIELARAVLNKRRRKYDWVLDEDLLSADYASSALDIPGAMSAISEAIDRESSG